MADWWSCDQQSIDWWPPKPARGSVGDAALSQGAARGLAEHEELLLSAGGAGLGYFPNTDVASSRGLDGSGRGSKHMAVLVWNAGDLDRRQLADFLLRTIVNKFHIVLLQEASCTRLHALCGQMGILDIWSPCRNFAILLGGTGHKRIRPLYPAFSGIVTVPYSTTKAYCLGFLAAEVSWCVDGPAPAPPSSFSLFTSAFIHRLRRPRPWHAVDAEPVSGSASSASAALASPASASGASASASAASANSARLRRRLPRPPRPSASASAASAASASASAASAARFVERCGRLSWRVATVHYHNDAATRGPDAVKLGLANLLRLMIRDRVDIVAGDFNQAQHYCREVCIALEVPFQILHGKGPEVLAIMFFHAGTSLYEVEARNMLADREDFGIRETDTSTHYPLVMIMTRWALAAAGRSELHTRSADAQKARKKKNRTKAKLKKKKRRLESCAAVASAEPADASSSSTSEPPLL